MMTNQEAIRILESMKDELILAFDHDRKEALSLAISALQTQKLNNSNQEVKESSDKLIKASDAVDIVAKHSALYGEGEITTDEGEALLYDIMSEIMNLPSAQPEQTGTQMSLANINDAIDAVIAVPSAHPDRKTGKWNFVGNQMYECTNCGVAYTEYQFEKMRVRYNDPKFPKFCPDCGSYNGGDSDGQT